MKKAMMIVAHGSRVEATSKVVFKIRDKIREKRVYQEVEAAFLEFNEPTIGDSIGGLYDRGVRHIVVAPMFLYEGNHILQDIPEELGKAKGLFPDLKLEMAKSLGADDRIADIIIERAEGELCTL